MQELHDVAAAEVLPIPAARLARNPAVAPRRRAMAHRQRAVAAGSSGEPEGDVLLLSMRRMADLVAYSMNYEFEDVIARVTGARRIDVDVDAESRIELSRRAYKLLRYASGSRRLARAFALPVPAVRLQRDYELFFPVFNHAYELFALNAVHDWRRRCRVAACYIAELWPHELPGYLLETLAEFDHVFVGSAAVRDEVARISGRPCSVLPLAADVPKFSPYPEPPARSIDVCNLGRRSEVAHEALLAEALHGRLFYYFDVVAASGIDRKQRTFRVHDAAEHRMLLAALLKRSRYYIANRARFNDPEFTRGHQGISGRYYEGVAAGAVLVGEPPDSALFRNQFDWPDAVLQVPFDAPDLPRVLREFDRDPERVARVQRANARQAALRHDWVHRLYTAYETLDLAPTVGMEERRLHLAELAAMAAEPAQVAGALA